MEVIICGDTLPRKEAVAYFSLGEIENIFDDGILKILNAADHRIVNLEGVLTESEKAIEKSGPSLKAPSVAIEGYKKIKVDFASLANNHMFDYGKTGLEDTIKVLEEAGIQWFGARCGKQKDLVIAESDGLKLGICSYAEREFNLSEKDDAGAKLFDDLDTPDEVSRFKEQVDALICLYHGGPECYRYPTPYIRKRCRKLVEKGADLVVCQHSHCIGCEEEYKGALIVYGQGNFCFNGSSNEYTDSALMLRVTLEKGHISTEAIPLVRKEYSIRLADDTEAKQIMGEYRQRSNRIKEEGFVEECFRKYALKKYPAERSKMYGLSGKALKLLGLDFVNRGLTGKKDNKALLNTVRNESHREILTEGLGFYFGEDE